MNPSQDAPIKWTPHASKRTPHLGFQQDGREERRLPDQSAAKSVRVVLVERNGQEHRCVKVGYSHGL